VDNFSGIPQYVLLKLKSTQDGFCSSDSETECCPSSPSGTMSAPLTESPGEEQLMLFAEDFPAKTLVPQEEEPALGESVRDYGKNMPELLTRYGLKLSLRKTLRFCGVAGLTLSSETCPNWGMMQDGACWELGTSARPIKETGCGYLLPTPDASKRGPCKEYNPKSRSQSGRTLQTLAACDPLGVTWPTPTTQDAKNNGSQSQMRRNTKPLDAAVTGTQTPPKYATPQSRDFRTGSRDRWENPERSRNLNDQLATRETGQLNPSWVEWLMGWPVGWTDLKPLETVRFQQWQQQHGTF